MHTGRGTGHMSRVQRCTHIMVCWPSSQPNSVLHGKTHSMWYLLGPTLLSHARMHSCTLRLNKACLLACLLAGSPRSASLTPSLRPWSATRASTMSRRSRMAAGSTSGALSQDCGNQGMTLEHRVPSGAASRARQGTAGHAVGHRYGLVRRAVTIPTPCAHVLLVIVMSGLKGAAVAAATDAATTAATAAAPTVCRSHRHCCAGVP